MKVRKQRGLHFVPLGCCVETCCSLRQADLEEDKKICELGGDNKDRLGACTRLIDSGTLSTNDLAATYDRREQILLMLSSDGEAVEETVRDEPVKNRVPEISGIRAFIKRP